MGNMTGLALLVFYTSRPRTASLDSQTQEIERLSAYSKKLFNCFTGNLPTGMRAGLSSHKSRQSYYL